MTTPYNGRCRLQFDVEHKCDLVEFGVENTTVGNSSERKIAYPNASIEKTTSSVYPTDGECYIFTSPPLKPEGTWVFSVAYRLNGTDNIIVHSFIQDTKVDPPENSLLKADADGGTP